MESLEPDGNQTPVTWAMPFGNTHPGTYPANTVDGKPAPTMLMGKYRMWYCTHTSPPIFLAQPHSQTHNNKDSSPSPLFSTFLISSIIYLVLGTIASSMPDAEIEDEDVIFVGRPPVEQGQDTVGCLVTARHKQVSQHSMDLQHSRTGNTAAY
jgi:hypothetical protein